MQVVALSRFLQSSLYFAAVFIGVRGIDDLTRVPISYGVATVVGLFPMAGLLRHHFSLRQRIPWERLCSIFISAITVGAAAICIQIYLNMDTVLLGFFKTSREVGLYTSAYKIVTLASSIPMLIFTSYLPFLIRENDNFSSDWKKYVLLMFSVGLPIGIGAGLFAPIIVTSLYGAEYQGAILPLRILSIDIIAVFVSITFAQPLLLFGKEKRYLSIVAWSAGLNLLCNLFMIPMFGMTGAAVTTVAAEGLVAIRSWRAMKQEVTSTFTKEIGEILVMAVAVFLFVVLCMYFLHSTAVLGGILFIVIYCVLLLLWYLKIFKSGLALMTIFSGL
jgi:O-antigen/teichoic acid export membrane protein